MKEFSESSKIFKPFYLVTFLPVMFLIVFQLSEQIKKHDKVAVIIFSSAIILNVCVAVFLYLLRLDLKVDEHGVHFRYRPLERRFTSYSWKDLLEAQVVTINPVRDFGGWGKKRSSTLGRAYLSTGNKALKITDTANNSIYITVIDEKSVNSILEALRKTETETN